MDGEEAGDSDLEILEVVEPKAKSKPTTDIDALRLQLLHLQRDLAQKLSKRGASNGDLLV